MSDFEKKPAASEIDKIFSSLLKEADGTPMDRPRPEMSAASPDGAENSYLYLVKPSEIESELPAVTGVWDPRKGADGTSSDSAAVCSIGRLLLSASGTNDIAELRARVETVLKREFECSPEFIRPHQWGQVIRAVEWIADESSQFQDVVRILSVLSDMPAPLHLRVTLKLRASFYLEHRLSNYEKALDFALGAHALSPLSTQTAGVVFEKIRCAGKLISSDKTDRYWKQIINLYLDVLSDRTLEKDKQVAVLLMLGWLFCDGMDDLERGCQCVARAKRLDPNNRAVAEKLAVMEAMCAASAQTGDCRPPVGCPPVPMPSGSNKTYSA